MSRLDELPFVKGHGAGNDFVVVPDVDGRRELTADQVRWICDRHTGIGGDGLLRVVRTEHVAGFEDVAGLAEFFMDYRNADGSIAEMCGNGARVFVRYLHSAGLVMEPAVVIATRGGLRSTTVNEDGTITVDMGAATSSEDRPSVRVGSNVWQATPVLVPNPHAVVFVDDLEEVGDLSVEPIIEPADAFPQGANVEFVVRRGPAHVAMRVHERGVGETMACGTGACAVAWVARRQGVMQDLPETYRVDVPGGRLDITETAAGTLLLTGPAQIVARGAALLPASVQA